MSREIVRAWEWSGVMVNTQTDRSWPIILLAQPASWAKISDAMHTSWFC